MSRHRFIPSLFVIALVAAAGLLPLAAQGPGPEVRARVDALLAALRSGSPEQFEAMAREHFTPDALARRTPAERKQFVESVRGEFGELTVERQTARSPGELELLMRGTKERRVRITVMTEPAPPFRITGVNIMVNAGPEPDQNFPGPPITGTMPAPELSKALDTWLAQLAAKDEFAGVVIVAKDGQPIFQRAYGLADRDQKTPITTSTRFNVGSIGKAFTRVAILQLVTQKKLTQDDTISTLLPDYPNEQARVATVEQLLTHRAGIVDFFGPRFDAAPVDQFKSNADYYRFVAPEPLLFAPGTRNQYCNGCYIVLGAIIERLSGMPYETYIAEHVFKPAGMTGASFARPEGGAVSAAVPYTRLGAKPGAAGEPVPPRENARVRRMQPNGSGGAYGQAIDLVAFDNALRERRLLNAEMTASYLKGEASGPGRATGDYGIAGGAPGVNALLEANGVWTVAVTGNLDPPNAGRVGNAIMRQLKTQ